MRALGRPVFGWTNVAEDFLARTLRFVGPAARLGPGDSWRDAEGMLLESFAMTDNLMIDGAILASGGALFVQEVAPDARWTDLAAFERCVAALAGRLGAR
jgi:nucleoside 2-deoxyribosyltransferase